MQLKKLEETLGHQLFERTRSGMVPTAAGERLLPVAIAFNGRAWRRQALASLDQAGIDWRLACTSDHYAAHKAAVAADLAVAPVPKRLMELGLARRGRSEGLPAPGTGHIAARMAPRTQVPEAAAALLAHVERCFGKAG